MPKTCSHHNCSYPVFSKGLCMSHWRSKYARRIPVYKSAGANNSIPKIKRRKAVKKISDKHAVELKVYSQLRERFLKEHAQCQVNFRYCTGLATEVHHSAYRGKNLLNVDTFFATCRNCHNYIHDNPKIARELKLLINI